MECETLEKVLASVKEQKQQLVESLVSEHLAIEEIKENCKQIANLQSQIKQLEKKLYERSEFHFDPSQMQKRFDALRRVEQSKNRLNRAYQRNLALKAEKSRLEKIDEEKKPDIKRYQEMEEYRKADFEKAFYEVKDAIDEMQNNELMLRIESLKKEKVKRLILENNQTVKILAEKLEELTGQQVPQVVINNEEDEQMEVEHQEPIENPVKSTKIIYKNLPLKYVIHGTESTPEAQ
ncbi:hypothetical protein EIN_224270 [Entamoeba invadens IP1]|uniref:Uncharacterized protein n=1 Tax=Entamoeba invadens IP1 TaxID=370355 RepID=A0A0A1U2C8_ENTIV|nr:hypothetical protein EIN_224270 [Entamoeba invadens IP1]ELP88184.1 hypothetical protein EIN_224270 [Entamoeba invadens IP1]|eukprot:XP_004254955.1 hypothetical protein EIN_224270 [Entamoeba invadens IP1]